MRKRSALILGFGYLGREIGRRLVEAGFQTYGTTRTDARTAELEAAGVRPVIYDVMHSAPEALPAVELLFYCVGFDRTGADSIADVYVGGLGRTLEAMPAPRRMVYVSSTGVYGDPQGEWVDESTEAAPIDAAGAACLDAERAAAGIAEVRGFDLVILRMAGIYGPGRMMNLHALRAGRPIAANPDAHVNLIHVDDAARTAVLAAEKAKHGAIYLVSDGQPILRREFYDAMARRWKTAPPVFDQAAARRQRGDRKISNARLLRELKPDFRFTGFLERLHAMTVHEGW